MQEAQREISSLESKLEQLKRAPKETGPKGPDSTARLETMLRMAENEKAGMRDAIAYEQKRVAAVEQRYSALFRDIALKEREINDLKTALTKFKKGTPTGKPEPTTAPSAELALLVKQADQRESYYKQELQAAKEKQAELLKRISELVSSLKKSGKAA